MGLHRLAKISGFVLLSACGNRAEDPGAALSTYKPCADTQRFGRFSAELGAGFSSVQGRVLSGVVPVNIREVTMEEGGCQLLRGRNLFCTPACGAAETCGENRTCLPYPTAKSVGDVAIKGLKIPLSISPTNMNYYSNGATTLPNPAFAPGDPILLSAQGGDFAGFSLKGLGVGVLTVNANAIPVARDTDLNLSWVPPAMSSAARLRLVVDLAHHGGIAASIVCDNVEDNGAFKIPAGLMTKLMDIGLAGFPKISFTRQSADSSMVGGGCVDFVVVSTAEREIQIPGLQSCNTDDDCPVGKKCQPDLTCK